MYFGGDDSPVVPNPLQQLRMYRWRESRKRWHRISPDRDNGEDEIPPSTIEFVSWNVSYDTPMVAQRMECVLRHLEKIVFKCRRGEAPEPCVVLLQEVHSLNGLDVILKDEWVREHFFVTPADTSKWPEGAAYGNVTLVEKSIPVADAHILEFGLSAMQRTGVMVDIRLGAPKPREYDVILRVINTHLESLTQGDDVRPQQLKLLTKFIKGPGIRGGIIGGDMNPIGPKDASLAASLGLRDAWRKGDNDERGFTWGEQPPTEYPVGRFDKILYLPRKGYRVDEPQRIGVGLKIKSDRLQGGSLWVSDHYGLWTKVHVLR
ncbi:Endonuclease/exonuclease/phosphatase [Mycena epipterygia]|nr:Endonuclease/exonuclease/phosphatase [Mycena epipterygia]